MEEVNKEKVAAQSRAFELIDQLIQEKLNLAATVNNLEVVLNSIIDKLQPTDKTVAGILEYIDELKMAKATMVATTTTDE